MKTKNIAMLLLILTIYSVFVNASGGYHKIEIEVEYIQKTMGKINGDHGEQLSSMITKALSKFRKVLSVRDTSTSVSVTAGGCGGRVKHNKVYRNVDFILFVEASSTGSCEAGKSIMAHAYSCEYDTVQINGQPVRSRPTVGVMTVCQHMFLARQEYQRKQWISTIQHELTHALVFNRQHMASYLSADGLSLLRTGDPKNIDSTFGAGGIITVIPGVLEEVVRNDWMTINGKIKHKVYMLKTPKVVEMVREYFSCPTLEGAEIESQGGSGTAGSHWEKRIMEHEAMTGVTTQVFAMSNISLALFEDSGWYQVDYSNAEPMTFGKGKGCDFVKKSCLELMNAAHDVRPFCKSGTIRYICSDDLKQKELCNMAEQVGQIPAPFAYGVAGQNQLADFCPYYSKYEQNTETAVDGTADSTCTHPGNMPKGKDQNGYLLEIYSRESRCFELSDYPVQMKKTNGETMKKTHQTPVACFEHKCNNGTLWVKTRHSKFYPCHFAGQKVHVKKRLADRSIVEFSIKCPACDKLCGSKCSTAPPPMVDYVGDKKPAAYYLRPVAMYLTILISQFVL